MDFKFNLKTAKIYQALKWGKASRVVISTESELIAAAALNSGALVP